jgi:proteasome lid subunit RPN8/RPN11
MAKTNTGILELAPYMSALITEAAFFAGGDVLHNPEVYILGNDGALYQYHQFSLGRSALTKISDTPIRLDGGKSLLKPYLKPLVRDQKIPLEFLENIVEFFKKVMAMTSGRGTGHGDYEAMAHIVWNKTTESYRVAIPKQKVAKASVSYNWDHVAADEEVILDIHSHNSMDAFFSGTDERDDATYVGISGVAGKLNTADPKLIWRFNAYKTKQKMELSEVFAVPEKQVSPEVDAWMGNVEVPTYNPPAYAGYSGYGGSRVFGGGSRSETGLSKSQERNPREDSWDARFQGQDTEGLTASARTSRSQASVDILGDDDGVFGAGSLGGSDPDFLNGLNWDDTVTELADTVWSEDDEELNVAIAAELAQRVEDEEVMHQAGLFHVVTASDARKAIERLNKDFDIRSA